MLRGPKPSQRAMSKTARQLFSRAASKGIPRKALASLLNVHVTTINYWAAGRRDMNATSLEALARQLQVEIVLQERQSKLEERK